MRSRPRTTIQSGNRELPDFLTVVRLSRARDFLGSHYRERVPLKLSAQHACLSPFHFNRRFTEVFGETPHEFVTRLRIGEAKKLLLSENHSITDICLETGYESLGSFSSRFRSLTGLSPAEFRQQSRRTFGGFQKAWALYYIPACYQQVFLGPL